MTIVDDATHESVAIVPVPLLDGAEISTMSQLAQWTIESEKVLVF